MSDLTGPLQSAIALQLRASARVLMVFGKNPVQIFDVPPDNAVAPYISLGPGTVDPLEAEGFDLSQCEYQVHAWSLTDPPSTAEAAAMAATIRLELLGGVTTSAGRVYATSPVRTTGPLIDPSDGRTAHAIVVTRFTTAPA